MSPHARFFVDSNLLLYYVDPADPRKRERAAEWLNRLWLAGAGCLSWQVLHEFYWNAVGKMRLEAGTAREIVEDLARWLPVESSPGLIRQAWHWMDTSRLSYWDALIVAAAQRCEAQFLLSEDFQAGRRYGDLRVLNPFDPSALEALDLPPSS